MKIQFISDLHLEFGVNYKFITKNPIQPKGEVLLLAGDVIQYAKLNRINDFLDYLSDHFEQTIWIPGNHEYFHYDIAEGRVGSFNEAIRSNVFLVNNDVIELDHCRIFPSTLWSWTSEVQYPIAKHVADYRFIKNHGKSLSVQDTNDWHQTAVQFLSSVKSFSDEKTNIALTHHVPTLAHYPAQFLNSDKLVGFATELDSLIESSTFKYWIYGHHHFNVPSFQIGNTQLMTNQIGYLWKQKEAKFALDNVIEI